MVAKLLADLHVPVRGLLDEGEFRRFLAGGDGGGGHLGEDGFELLDGFFTEGGTDELDAGRVEGDSDDEVGHLCFFFVFFFF